MTDLNRLSKGHAILNRLVEQAESWQHTAAAIVAKLPANLGCCCRAVRVREGVLVMYADNNMVAARLRMLVPAMLPAWQAVCAEIREVYIKISPPPQIKLPAKQAKLSQEAAGQCRAAADRLAHHPELAAALRHLARHADEADLPRNDR